VTLLERIPAAAALALLALCLFAGVRRGAPRPWLFILLVQSGSNVWGQISNTALLWWPWFFRQVLYLSLDLALLVAMAQLLTSGRTRLLARLIVGGTALAIWAAAIAPTSYDPLSSSSWVATLMRVDMILAAGFVTLLGLLAWHGRPAAGLPAAIVAGAASLRALHVLALWCWQAPGLRPVGNVFPWLECVVFAWWLAEAWPMSARRRLARAFV